MENSSTLLNSNFDKLIIIPPIDSIYFYLKDQFHEQEFIHLNDGRMELEDTNILINDFMKEIEKNISKNEVNTNKDNKENGKKNSKILLVNNSSTGHLSESPNKKVSNIQKINNSPISTNPTKKFYLKAYVKKEKNFFDHRNSLKSYNPIIKNFSNYRKSKENNLPLHIIEEKTKKQNEDCFIFENGDELGEDRVDLKNLKEINKSSFNLLEENNTLSKSLLSPIPKKSSMVGSRGSSILKVKVNPTDVSKENTPVKLNYKANKISNNSDLNLNSNLPINLPNILNQNETKSNLVKNDVKDVHSPIYQKNSNYSFDLGYNNVLTDKNNVPEKKKRLGSAKIDSKVRNFSLNKPIEEVLENDYNKTSSPDMRINLKLLTHLLNAESMNPLSEKYEKLKQEIINIKSKLEDPILRRKVFTKMSNGRRDKLDFMNNLFKIISQPIVNRDSSLNAINVYKNKKQTDGKSSISSSSKKKRSTTFLTKLSVIEENKLEARNSTNSELNGGLNLKYPSIIQNNQGGFNPVTNNIKKDGSINITLQNGKKVSISKSPIKNLNLNV